MTVALFSSCSGGLRPLVELCVEPAGLCGQCTGVAVQLRVVPSPTGLTSKRGPGLGSFSRADRGIGPRTSLVAQTVKHLSTMPETRVRSPGWEDPLKKEMAIHSSTIAWKIPWTEEPGRLQSVESQSRTRLSDFTFTFTHSAAAAAKLLQSHPTL